MKLTNTFGSMDEQTYNWLTSCIETAPDTKSLDGIRITIEWFYDIDKDIVSFTKLINRIIERESYLITTHEIVSL